MVSRTCTNKRANIGCITWQRTSNFDISIKNRRAFSKAEYVWSTCSPIPHSVRSQVLFESNADAGPDFPALDGFGKIFNPLRDVR
ncbi:unnamed protein product [Leptosia nina]|uniref:Uncharacterized protein n=1 Tax=Leptosia nina TaxID=320188 RepID=A0AAV1JQY9_9NEOP